MSTLKSKAEQILQEKETNIIPENIKDGVQIFDVTGDYIGSDSLDLTTGIKFACSTFSTLPNAIVNANWSSMIDIYSMFSECIYLTTIPLLDTSNVTIMSDLFYGCERLSSIPQLNTSNVTDMSNMFFGCASLTTLPKLDYNNVRNVMCMFYGCTSLTELDISTLNIDILDSDGNMDDFITDVPDNCHILVASQQHKDILLQYYPNLTNIEVVTN